MPSLADYLTTGALRAQTVWRLLKAMPVEITDAAQFAALNAGVPDLGWSAGEIQFDSLGGATAVDMQVTTDRLSQGGEDAFAAALLFPGSPDVIVLVLELRGGYSLGSGDFLSFRLNALLPGNGG